MRVKWGENDAMEKSVFEQIVAQHHERVARLAYRLLGWRGEVDDVVQEVFLKALARLHKFRGESSHSTWLTQITLNVCQTHRRKQMLRLRWWRNHALCERIAPSAEAGWRDSETNERVRQAMRALPPKEREVVVLFYLEERSSAEIAKLLTISVNAVDIRLHRARERLRPMLEDWVKA